MVRTDFDDARAQQVAGRVGETDAEADAEAQVVPSDGPSYATAQLHRALSLLARRQWPEGWAAHEWRERLPAAAGARRAWSQPRWEGEPVAGRTVLVHAEHGAGDTLNFVRWLAPLRGAGARVVLMVPTPLQALLAGSDLADQVVAFSDATPPHDLQVPLLGLPHRLGLHTDAAVIRGAAPYLRVPQVMDAQLAAWQAALPSDRLRVGVAWAGSPTHPNDLHRSIPLEQFEPLLAMDDVTWVSLQAGDRASDIDQLPWRLPLHDAAPLLTTFQRTAQLVQQLDAVVTVDSAVAHLAGALGRRGWVLLPRIGRDWRWAAETADWRWYQGIQTVRQASPGVWREAMLEVRARLSGLVSANSAVSAGAMNRATPSTVAPPPPRPVPSGGLGRNIRGP